MENETSLSERLEKVLSEEYNALLGGRIEELEALGTQKVEILETVSGLPEARVKDFQRLRAKLLRNQLLAQSALEGMRVALERAREVSDIAQSLKTYRSDGKQHTVGMRRGDALFKRS